jgi:hypothetical protein
MITPQMQAALQFLTRKVGDTLTKPGAYVPVNDYAWLRWGLPLKQTVESQIQAPLPLTADQVSPRPAQEN